MPGDTIESRSAARIARMERDRRLSGLYVVWSRERGAWWRAESRGYCVDIAGAGLYEREEAISIMANARDGWTPGRNPSEIAICVGDLPPAIREVIADNATEVGKCERETSS